jgi:hypothetical protein
MSQMATTEVLPKPVGMLHDEGMLSGRSETNRSYNASCHGNGELPVSFSKASSKLIDAVVIKFFSNQLPAQVAQLFPPLLWQPIIPPCPSPGEQTGQMMRRD